MKFVATRPFVTSVIIGATSLDQLEQNLAAFDRSLDDEVEAKVCSIHVVRPNPCP